MAHHHKGSCQQHMALSMLMLLLPLLASFAMLATPAQCQGDDRSYQVEATSRRLNAASSDVLSDIPSFGVAQAASDQLRIEDLLAAAQKVALQVLDKYRASVTAPIADSLTTGSTDDSLAGVGFHRDILQASGAQGFDAAAAMTPEMQARLTQIIRSLISPPRRPDPGMIRPGPVRHVLSGEDTGPQTAGRRLRGADTDLSINQVAEMQKAANEIYSAYQTQAKELLLDQMIQKVINDQQQRWASTKGVVGTTRYQRKMLSAAEPELRKGGCEGDISQMARSPNSPRDIQQILNGDSDFGILSASRRLSAVADAVASSSATNPMLAQNRIAEIGMWASTQTQLMKQLTDLNDAMNSFIKSTGSSTKSATQ